MLLNKRIPLPYIFNKVKHELLYTLLISLSLIFFTTNFQHVLPEMPLTIPAFIGTAISILLSFKLNQSYDRWWEARKIWGSIVNDSRTLVIQLNSLVASGEETVIKRVGLRQIGWCYSLGNFLRNKNETEFLKEFMSNDDVDAVSKHANQPLAILGLIAEDIRILKEKGKLTEYAHIQIDSTLVRLCDSQGRAERIKNTVFPVTYRLFMHFIIYLFLITLSISLVDVAGHFEVPLLVVLSTSFFLLEKSATHMQNPFENMPTDTSVTSIARTIEINLKQLLKLSSVPPPLEAENFYLL